MLTTPSHAQQQLPSSAINSSSSSSSSAPHGHGLGHFRRPSLNSSQSANNVAPRIRRSGSLSSSNTGPAKQEDQDQQQRRPASREEAARKPKKLQSRRRSSVAHIALEKIQRPREEDVDRWSQSTASSKASAKDPNGGRRPSFARRLSSSASSALHLHGSTALPPPSPKRPPGSSPRRSPAPPSPQVRKPQRSPIAGFALSLDQLPAFDAGPPLSATIPARLATPSPGFVQSDDYFGARAEGSVKDSDSVATVRNQKRGYNSPQRSPFIVDIKSRADTPPKTPTSFGPSLSSPERRREKQRRIEEGGERRGSDDKTSSPGKTRDRREKDKKAMLSRALQKANTAVVLDNAQNFELAKEAYTDACKLLQQVMQRTSSDEDKKKLDAIRVTYTSRIQELEQLDPDFQTTSGKSLPARPTSNESYNSANASGLLAEAAEDTQPPFIGTATITRIIDDKSIETRAGIPAVEKQQPEQTPKAKNPRESLFTSTLREVEESYSKTSAPGQLQPPFERREKGDAVVEQTLTLPLESPMDKSYIPAPLSPRPFGMQNNIRETKPEGKQECDPNLAPTQRDRLDAHSRGNSGGSVSWLDTIDESGGSSCSSSVHSLSSVNGLQRKPIRIASGVTEAEFDAALDAAVEAAYDEGLEPYEYNEQYPGPSDKLAKSLSKVELAKQKVREAEREELISAAHYRERERLLRKDALPQIRNSVELDYQGDEAEEEERMLDEMTKEYMLDGFDFGLENKSSLPRTSDSSGFSGTTWSGSVSSSRTTAGTSLSTVLESDSSRSSQPTIKIPQPPGPPPAPPSEASENSPQRPPGSPPKPPTIPSASASAGVRSRRLSGQNAKQLKIETAINPTITYKAPPQQDPSTQAKDNPALQPPASIKRGPSPFGDPNAFKLPGLPASQSTHLRAGSPSQQAAASPSETVVTISPATPGLNDVPPPSPGGSKFSSKGLLKKNKSSLSLKNRQLSVSSPDGSDGSVGTPMSTTFSAFPQTTSRSKNLLYPTTSAPTPSVPAFNVEGLPTGGMHLFESDIHSPYSPGTPNPLAANAPIPLEPCPEAHLLRPFWLMRCFYQTIAHPRGGYLSTKLFVPRDVWSVKNVKLKNVEDKIANCDLLTAALQKLGSVDTLDADAVLEEMQALELILDQVQAQLTKKLGNEVGVNGITNLFKDAPAHNNHGDGSQTDGNGSGMGGPTRGSSSNASSSSNLKYLTSWRKLRSKNSGVSLASTFAAAKDPSTGCSNMNTVPMTSLNNIRFVKRDVTSVEFGGPHVGYMGALARLCDAVQVVDQIARQVEDPGLKHSSPTHVGLELCTRHAAEFFGFYICRFVLTDLTLMLDKFIKRGSEWVLV